MKKVNVRLCYLILRRLRRLDVLEGAELVKGIRPLKCVFPRRETGTQCFWFL